MAEGIREAVEADLPRILEMGARSLAEGPYRNQLGSADAAAEFALDLLRRQNARILVYEKEGQAVGLIAFLVFPHYFSGEPTGGEVIWYVEPEHRKSFAALALLRSAERMAKEMGAKRMQFTAPTEEVARAYEVMGYQKIEVSYQRNL